jgi:hypothetical protein
LWLLDTLLLLSGPIPLLGLLSALLLLRRGSVLLLPLLLLDRSILLLRLLRPLFLLRGPILSLLLLGVLLLPFGLSLLFSLAFVCVLVLVFLSVDRTIGPQNQEQNCSRCSDRYKTSHVGTLLPAKCFQSSLEIPGTLVITRASPSVSSVPLTSLVSIAHPA